MAIIVHRLQMTNKDLPLLGFYLLLESAQVYTTTALCHVSKLTLLL